MTDVKNSTPAGSNFLYRATHLGRQFHPRHPSHKRVLQIMGLGGAMALALALLSGVGLVSSLLTGPNAALAAFIGWALARELDPDRPTAALLAAGWGILAVVLLGPVGLLPAALVMGLARVVNRSVGLPPKLTDSLVLLGGTGIVMLAAGDWTIGLIGALAFAADSCFGEDVRRRHLLFALLAAAASAAYLAFNGLPAIHIPSLTSGAAAGFIALLALVKLARLRRVGAEDDAHGEPLRPARVRGALILALAAGLLGLLSGDPGVLRYGPLWAALLGVGI